MVKQRRSQGVCHPPGGRETSGREVIRQVLVPRMVKDAVVVGEEDLAVPGIQRTTDRNIPGARRSPVRGQHNVLHLMTRQRVSIRARVVDNVNVVEGA